MASEIQLRKLAAQQIGTNLTGEMVPFTFVLKNGGGRPSSGSLVYVPHLVAKVVQVLEQNERYTIGLSQDSRERLDVLSLCLQHTQTDMA